VDGAEAISVGSELLLGEVVDTNLTYLADELARVGLPLRRSRQLRDARDELAAALREARAASQLVVVGGGLGPTHDDLTREALADALHERLAPDPALEADLRRRFGALGRPMPAANLRQALRVPSAEAIPNPIGSAPGWWVDRDGSVTVLLPGVPAELRRMWTEQVAPRLAGRFETRPVHRRVVRAFGIGESAVAERLSAVLGMDDPVSGIYARDDGIHVRFSTRGDPSTLEAPVRRAIELLARDCYGTDRTTLPLAAVAVLEARGIRSLASVEVGSGGALAAILSEAGVAGSMRYAGGLVRAPDGGGSPPPADVLVTLALLPERHEGVSPAEIALRGALGEVQRRVTVFGSGPQRLRRAAFGAIDLLRRAAAGAP